MDYDFALSSEAARFLLACPPRARREVLVVLEKLARDPFQAGDFQEVGLSGRHYEVKLAGVLAVTYWVDHAVREVRVVRCTWADS